MLIVLGILVSYVGLGILTARRLVYQEMCRNERATYAGKKLEARLYTNDDYKRIAREARPYGYISDSDVPASDMTFIAYKSIVWPGLWTFRVLRAMVMNGHRKTPGQREKELAEREKRMKELEAQREREWKNKLKEAGIEE